MLYGQKHTAAVQKHARTSMPHMNAARRASDCRPDPPTPTSSMWPPGCVSRRHTRDTCSAANRNMARFMGRLEVALKSWRYSSSTEMSCAVSVISV